MHKNTHPFDEAWDHGFKLDRDDTWYHPCWPEYQASLEIPSSRDIYRYRMYQWRNKGKKNPARPGWQALFDNSARVLRTLWLKWTNGIANKP